MTSRTSEVAVCCSSASLRNLLNSRAFSMAMTAWSAKVCSNSTWCAENGPGFPAADEDDANRRSLAHQGHYNTLRKPRARPISLNGKPRLGFGVGEPPRSRRYVPVKMAMPQRVAGTGFHHLVRSRI